MMTLVLSPTEKSKKITKGQKSLQKRVENCYKNLDKKDLKFTDDMVVLIEMDFIDHFECKLSEIENKEDLNPITKRYLDECKKRLNKYDPTDVRVNLRKMDLI